MELKAVELKLLQSTLKVGYYLNCKKDMGKYFKVGLRYQIKEISVDFYHDYLTVYLISSPHVNYNNTTCFIQTKSPSFYYHLWEYFEVPLKDIRLEKLKLINESR